MPAEAALSGEPIIPIGLAAEPSPAAPVNIVSLHEDVAAGPKPMQPFNLRKPSLLTAGELRRLRMRHDEFARSLATRLSIHLRLELGVQVLGLDTCFYPKLIERFVNPTQVALFNINTLDGVGLLEISPKLGIAIVDRLLGGAGKAVALNRDLSEIETALLDQAIDLLLKEWCQVVASMPQAQPVIASHETNPHFLQSAPNDTSVVVLSLEVHLQDVAEKVHLAFPYAMLQPIVRQLNPPVEAKKGAAPPPPLAMKWNPELNSVRIPLTVQWDGLQINARKLAHLKVGDVLPVDPERINHTCVQLARIPKFTGRLGKCGQVWAIELLQQI